MSKADCKCPLTASQNKRNAKACIFKMAIYLRSTSSTFGQCKTDSVTCPLLY